VRLKREGESAPPVMRVKRPSVEKKKGGKDKRRGGGRKGTARSSSLDEKKVLVLAFYVKGMEGACRIRGKEGGAAACRKARGGRFGHSDTKETV